MGGEAPRGGSGGEAPRQENDAALLIESEFTMAKTLGVTGDDGFFTGF
jgi:hypothetical protein